MDTRKRLLIISVISLGRDGISNIVMSYLEYLSLRTEAGYCDTYLLVPYIKENMQIPEEAYFKESIINMGVSRKDIIRYSHELSRVLRSKQFDAVYVHGSSCLISLELMIAKINGVKIRIAHSHSTRTRYPILNSVFRPLFNRLYTHGFACSNAAGEWLFKKNPYTVLNNGISLDKYEFSVVDRIAYREKLNIGNKTLLGNVGNFVEAKNHQFAIEILAKLPNRENFKMLFLGSGKLEEECKLLASKLGVSDSVIFAGSVENVTPYLSAMDLFIAPSLYEGLPLVLVEAQANGLNLIVSNAITKEVNLTNRMQFLSLENKDEWIRAISGFNNELYYSRNPRTCPTIAQMIKDAGYSKDESLNYMSKQIMEIINK